MKTAFLFPGQGAQYVGMAKDFYDNVMESRDIVDRAADCLDFDIKKTLFEDNDIINKTEYTQACLLTAEIAMYAAVKKMMSPDFTAGLSLGEYAALVASGAMDFEDAVRLVRARGRFMEFAVPCGRGAMAAVIGLGADVIEEVCASVSSNRSTVVPANYNCPGQIVISGERAAVETAADILKQKGAKLVTILNVSGPFHSPLLVEAGEKLSEVLSGISVSDPAVPYVTNVTAKLITDSTEIKNLLVRQVSSSVRWEQSVREMLASGVEQFIEIGPGRTLSGFMKRIDREIGIITVGKYEDLEKLTDIIGGRNVGSKHTAA